MSETEQETPTEPTASVRRGTVGWTLWSVPLLAVLIGLYWIYRGILNTGPEITILFPDGSGLSTDKSIVQYRGIQVGRVTGLALTEDGDKVRVRVRLDPAAALLAREGSAFWIVRPKVSSRGVSGLSTLVSGPYIEALAGSGKKANHFQGLAQRPLADTGGIDVLLETPRLHSVDKGSVLLFRGVPVGEVLDTRLGEAGDRVLVKVHVQAPYRHLLRANSRFWVAGGLGLDFSLFGSSTLKATSLESLVRGAVAFATPDGPGKEVEAGHTFALADKADPQWLKWRPAFGGKRPPTPAGAAPVKPDPFARLPSSP